MGNNGRRGMVNGNKGWTGDSFDSKWVSEWNGSSTVESVARSLASTRNQGAKWDRVFSWTRLIVANQQQNTSLDPRRQQHAPQKLNAPGLPISFHYPPQDPHSTPRTRTAITGSIRLLPRHPQPPPQSPLHGKDRCTTPTLDTNEGPEASAVSSVHKFVAGSFLKSGGRKCRRRG